MITKEESKILKGLFMITVVICHSLNRYFNPTENTRIVFSTLCNNVGMFGFTFLSGYGIYLSTRTNINDFWQKRIINVFIPALLANILVTLCSLLVGINYTREEIYDSVFMLSRYNKINGSIWYIPFIFSWYLIFWIIELINHKNKAVGFTVLSIVTAILWYMYPVVHPNVTWYAFSFVLGWGYAVLNNRRQLGKIKGQYILSIIACIVTFIVMCTTTENSILIIPIPFRFATVLQNLLSLICILGLIQVVKPIVTLKRMALVKKVGLWIGGISFEIYLFHLFILVHTVDNKIIDGNLLTFIVNIILVVIVAKLFQRAYERVRIILNS